MQDVFSPLNLEEIMRPQTYSVEPSEEERTRLLMLTRQGTAPARVVRRAGRVVPPQRPHPRRNPSRQW